MNSSGLRRQRNAGDRRPASGWRRRTRRRPRAAPRTRRFRDAGVNAQISTARPASASESGHRDGDAAQRGGADDHADRGDRHARDSQRRPVLGGPGPRGRGRGGSPGHCHTRRARPGDGTPLRAAEAAGRPRRRSRSCGATARPTSRVDRAGHQRPASGPDRAGRPRDPGPRGHRATPTGVDHAQKHPWATSRVRLRVINSRGRAHRDSQAVLRGSRCAPGPAALAVSRRRQPSAARSSRAVSDGVLPTFTPTASRASFLACAVPEDPETIAPAWPMVLPSGAVNPAT